ncbi:hypothetical protein [Paenibacillus sp. HW567]|uniref:hypothetical protein n=1 Tax=Paenibacillus sp. HW567 TaxID=1034769 RepID=UPI00038014AB|nr:hypothetical protein [Paenibacillus sp. HW567]
MKKVFLKLVTILTMLSLVALPLGKVATAAENLNDLASTIPSTGVIEESGVFEADGVKITYDVDIKGDVISYNLFNNGVEQTITYNQSKKELYVDGKLTDISSLLGSTDNLVQSTPSFTTQAATDIPPDVGRTAIGPNGETGQLTKYTESNSSYTKITMSAVAAALSTLVKAPYSAVLAALSVIIGAYPSATVYYREQLYFTSNPSNYWFEIFKTYSDPEYKHQISRDVYYVMIW